MLLVSESVVSYSTVGVVRCVVVLPLWKILARHERVSSLEAEVLEVILRVTW